MEHTIGIVLAGVHDWDESGLDRLGPRPLLPVLREPLICGALHWLRQAGLRRVVICANSGSRAVRRALGDGRALGLDVEYYEDWTPRGPAGCVRDAALAVGAERVLVAEGTVWPDGDPNPLVAAHVESGVALTVVATEDGAATLDRAAVLAPVGSYVVERTVLEHVPATGYQDFKEVLLPRLHERGVATTVYRVARPGPRPTDLDRYRALNAWGLSRRLRAAPVPGYRRVGMCEIHETAEVAASARLLGPVLIGPRTRVGADALVVGPAVLGDGGTVEAGAVICESVLWNEWRVEARALVEACVVGHGGTVGRGGRVHGTVIVCETGAAPGISAGVQGAWRRMWRRGREVVGGRSAVSHRPATVGARGNSQAGVVSLPSA